MPDISKIRLENTDYNIKDQTARNQISNINTQITNINNNISELDLSEFVVFGDSWSDSEVLGTVWTDVVKKALNVNLHNYAKNGAGFLMPTNNLIETQIVRAQNDTSYNHNKVKYVVLCGGINDFRNNVNNKLLKNKIIDLYNICKTNYQNAKVIYVNNFQYPYTQQQSFYWYLLQYNLSSYNIPVLNQDGFFKKDFFVNNLFHLTQAGQRLFASNIVSALTGGQIKNDGVIISFDLFATYLWIKRVDNMLLYCLNINNLGDTEGQTITPSEEMCWIENFRYQFFGAVGQAYSNFVAQMNDSGTITIARNNVDIKRISFNGVVPISIEL